MILPTKHIHFSASILGFGCYILSKLNNPKSIDQLWFEYQKDLDDKFFTYKHTFDTLILTLIFLYSINSIEEKNGTLNKCD